MSGYFPEDQDWRRNSEESFQKWCVNGTLTACAFTGFVAATLRAGRVVEKER